VIAVGSADILRTLNDGEIRGLELQHEQVRRLMNPAAIKVFESMQDMAQSKGACSAG
jgi:hypothetical protein